MYYLDVAATNKNEEINHIIIDTMTRAMDEYWMNPSSLYASYVKEEIDKCRHNIAKFISADASEIYFTSGASESNNWVIRGYADEIWSSSYKNANIITTRIEHKSILEAINNDSLGAYIHYCDVDKYGIVDINSLGNLLSKLKNESILVSIGLANNEIGVIQNIGIISDLVHQYNGILHVDATQAIGHIPIDVKEFGIDLMSASGHKISPVLKGVGFLYKKNGINIKPLIYGAQENGLRGGTENTFGIIGLSKAIDYCDISNKTINDMIDKRNYFIALLENRFKCKLNGHNDYRLPNNINVTFPQNITGESLLYTLEMSDIFISTGSACNSKSITPSHVLKEIGLSDEEAMRSVRFTLPDDITYDDISDIVKEIDKAIKIIEM